MPSLTPNYSFNLPGVADPIDADLWGGQLNANWSKMDTLLEGAGLQPVTGDLHVPDDTFRIVDNVDSTKEASFNVSSITAATTRTLTVQDVSGTVIVTGGMDLPIADGGTGASTALAAFDALKQAATNTYAGVSEIATTAEIVTGTDNTRTVSPAGLYGALGVSSYADSGNLTITNLVTWAHGLPRVPVRVDVFYFCSVAQAGYSPGDVVYFPGGLPIGSAITGISATFDTTNVYVRSGSGGLALLNKVNGNLESISGSNWRFIIRAWA